jgi:hypothetical protein
MIQWQGAYIQCSNRSNSFTFLLRDQNVLNEGRSDSTAIRIHINEPDVVSSCRWEQSGNNLLNIIRVIM